MGHEGAVPTTAVRNVFERSTRGEPFTSTEVAAEVGCARTTAYKKLQRLAADGDLKTKKVGARGRVWWLPMEGPTDADALDREDPEVDYETLLANERQYRAVFEQGSTRS